MNHPEIQETKHKKKGLGDMKKHCDRLNAAAYIVFLVLAVILSIPLFILISFREAILELKCKYDNKNHFPAGADHA